MAKEELKRTSPTLSAWKKVSVSLLVVIVFCQSCNVLDHNLLSGLELEQLEDQAYKLCWLLGSILATDRRQLVCLFDNRGL